GAFLIPTMMSVYIGMIVIIGAFFLYNGLFVRTSSQLQERLNKISI
ncbi:MDR family MFS transporter, partial [Bacillus cereus group sp. Bce005]